MLRRVACGISGGVDSAVAAHLLRKKGHKVVGVFMKNWDQTDESGVCSADEELADAEAVCEKLNIELVQVNFVKEYWHNVFCDMITSYETGSTPNPDVLCNKYIKFGSFFEHCFTNLGVDCVATGHYSQNSFGNCLEKANDAEVARLLIATDRWKDQTLFLSQISQDALKKTMFPVGSFFKSEVKRIAQEIGLDFVAQKKESTGICFIGKRNFQEFIEEYVSPKEGRFIDIENFDVVGHHKGTHYWTIGQRALIPGLSSAYFIVKVDSDTQDILVANNTHHPALYSKEMFVADPHWISGTPEQWLKNGLLECDFKFQHVHQLQKCVLHLTNGSVAVKTELPIRALTPGQFCVFYYNDQCLGSAKILKIGESLYEQGIRGLVQPKLLYESKIV